MDVGNVYVGETQYIVPQSYHFLVLKLQTL